MLLVIALLCGNAVFSYQSVHALITKQVLTANTLEILKAVEDIALTVQDYELSLRAIIIMQSNSAPAAAPGFREQLRRGFLHLRMIPSEVPNHLVQLDYLEQLVMTRLDTTQHLFESASRSPHTDWPDSTPKLLASSTFFLSEFRRHLADFESQEYQLLAAQQHRAERHRQNVLTTTLVANGALALLIVIVAWLLRRSIDHQLVESRRLETMVKQRTVELERSSAELERSNSELQRFAFVASHDLQEPLRKIQAFGSRLQKRFGAGLGPDGNDYLERMQQAAERMSRLINDLLKLSRITTDSDPCEQVDLNEAVKEAIENLEVRIEEAEARIECSALPSVQGSPQQLCQLFQNLLGNSIKFVPPERKPHICIFAESSTRSIERQRSSTNGTHKMQDQHWLIKITDNGIGIDSEQTEHIFAPFKRLHGQSEYAGSGIGLSICRRIVERHGGTISVSSTPGEGSSFSIELPADHPDNFAHRPSDQVKS